MIVGVVGYLFAVSLLTYAAAWAMDDGLRRLGRPTRWVWLAALAAPPALLLVPRILPAGADGALGPVAVVELPGLVVGGGVGPTVGLWLEAGLAGAWLLGSLGLAALLVSMHRRLLRERRRWAASTVAGRDVYLSADRGPAVAGVVRPWIVLPRWALSLPRRELDLVVLHEEEHVRARDTQLLAAALLCVVLTPWNPLSWLALRALKVAMEVDCDRRVLRRAPDPEAYGGSLISVAARSSGLSLGLAAFTERRRSLKTRIIAMTRKHSRWTPLRTALLALVAVLLGVQACSVESPLAEAEGDRSEADVVAPDRADAPAGTIEVREEPELEAREEPEFSAREVSLSEEPTFTPFTIAPSITNRSEVVAAMNDEYPPLLRDAGIGGTVVVWFFIEETGQVGDVRIHESSGHRAIDDAALRVAGVYRFSPARNGDEAAPVWVQFPITFQASGGS